MTRHFSHRYQYISRHTVISSCYTGLDYLFCLVDIENLRILLQLGVTMWENVVFILPFFFRLLATVSLKRMENSQYQGLRYWTGKRFIIRSRYVWELWVVSEPTYRPEFNRCLTSCAAKPPVNFRALTKCITESRNQFSWLACQLFWLGRRWWMKFMLSYHMARGFHDNEIHIAIWVLKVSEKTGILHDDINLIDCVKFGCNLPV